MAPTVAVSELLKQTGLALQDFDFYEIHEAFAAQVLATLKAWESRTIAAAGWDGTRLGVDRSGEAQRQGLSIAFGHPFAATGARILAVLAKLLHSGGWPQGSDFGVHGGRHGCRRHSGRGVTKVIAKAAEPAEV